MGFRVRPLAILGIVMAPIATAWANVGIPGPLMHYGASLSVSPWQWIAVTMAMCIGVEAGVYLYSAQYRRPLLASIYANLVTLVLGVPLGLLGAIDPTWFVLPTFLSIFLEYWAIVALKARFEREVGSIKLGPVFWGNVISNLLLCGLLYVAVRKQ